MPGVDTLWASRNAMSRSGKTTRSAPTRSRISRCTSLEALAKTRGTRRFFRCVVISTLASTSAMATMARSTSVAPDFA